MAARHVAALEPTLAAVRPRLAGAPGRLLIGIVGPPGAGKSTLAAALVTELSTVDRVSAVVVPMDGFHLANAELHRLGLADRKGAPQTFDAVGFVHLLGRLRDPDGEVVYAPLYSRVLHESIGGAIAVAPDVTVVVVEGNYLLLDEGPWARARPLLDLAVYLDASEATRLPGLVRRHRARGLDVEAARAFAMGSDEANARIIAATRRAADVIVTRD